MKKIVYLVLLCCLAFFIVPSSFGAYDPASRPNNKFGIHILSQHELARAQTLVNSAGGDWGYVTIPIQAGDRDLDKWQGFMDEARQKHLIPIIRIATEAYWANTNVWRKPTDFDILDFANFLNSLEWPTTNRYVLLFNESNRYDEWGGEPPSPESYADFVVYAVETLKSKSPDFYVIAGGLDNASPNDRVKYLDNFVFLRRMGQHNPDVFKKIDGFSSHSYPNPNFAQAPSNTAAESTSTYKHELEIIKAYGGGEKPVFITETGWNADVLSQDTVGSYFKVAMTDIWGKDPRVVAVTPFILESNGGPFDKFTFYKGDRLTAYGKVYQDLSKVKGEPTLTTQSKRAIKVDTAGSEETFDFGTLKQGIVFTSRVLRSYFKAVFAIDK